MLRLPLVALVGIVVSLPAFAEPATRLASVQDGVLRWQDDGSEVALFGVNYYVPFSIDYQLLKERGLDHEQAIRDDVAHFQRLGLTAIRLHCWDREISDRQGNLVDSEHLKLLDYLIAECKQRGIYSVMTAMAWWQAPEPGGFSDLFTMPQMTTDPQARQAQCRYLAQYVNHVNRYTGLAYKDDPAIIALELINEPQYPAGTTAQQVTEYANDLCAAIRATGCRKPIFYNCWDGKAPAVGASTLDGATFGWYPTGLVAGLMLRDNYLPSVDDYPSMRDPALAKKAKIVYEFDAADVHGSVMYPAMARAFRSGGAQIATQFQYEPMCLADGNPNWQTHYLNLIYTPGKALSFAIAAEAFRRLPRLSTFGRYPESARFGPFRLSFEDDLSEMVTDEAFVYSNDTKTPPPAPAQLTRVWGCGSSPLVQYDGTGAYFLDRVASGVWKLQVYPDAVMVADPYAGGVNEKVRVLYAEHRMAIALPDLGEGFRALTKPYSTAPASAAGRTLPVRPGQYLLVRSGVEPPKTPPAEEFIAPAPRDLPPAAYVQCADSWREGFGFPVRATVAASGEVRCALQVRPEGAEAYTEVPLSRTKPYEYRATVAPGLVPMQYIYSAMPDSGSSECHLACSRSSINVPSPSSVTTGVVGGVESSTMPSELPVSLHTPAPFFAWTFT
jgi:hypothetical protein